MKSTPLVATDHLQKPMNKSPDDSEIRVERIRDEAGFRALQHCWNQLLQESTANTMFLSWEWLYTWFKHLREDRELLILRLTHGEETIALIPLAIRPNTLSSFLGVRVVEFLGTGKAGAEVFPKPRLAQELSCCWQDARGLSRAAKPVQPNALGQKLSCCWQDRAAVASGRGPSGVEGFVPRPGDSFRDSVASNQGFGHATYASYRGTLVGTRRHARASGDGSRCGAAVGRTAVHRPFAAPDISLVERGSYSTGNAVRPCWRCRTEAGRSGLGFRSCYRVRTASPPNGRIPQRQCRRKCCRLIPAPT